MIDMINKIPPHSREAEESILSAAMLGAARDIVEMLSSEDFYATAHSNIFEAITELCNKSKQVDIITVSELLRSKNILESVGGSSYISRIIDVIPASASIKDHAGIIKQASQKRKIIEICSRTIQSCYNGQGVDEIMGEMDKETSKIKTHSGGFFKIGDLLPGMIDKLESMRKNPGPPGILTGLTDVDRMLGGLQGSNLYVIGARPSMGKSALGMRFCRGAAKTETPCLFVSIEMSRDQVVARETSCFSGIDGERLMCGDLDSYHWEKISTAASEISELPIWIDDSPSATIKEIQSKIRQFYKSHGRCLVVIDYLQYIKGVESERHDIEIGTITRGLKTSAKTHDIPVVLLAQLSRQLEQRTDRRPIASDLRGSGEIEQDADIIAFLYRDEVYNPTQENHGVAEFIVRKHRNGKTGPLFLTWIEHRTTFENYIRATHDARKVDPFTGMKRA